MQKDLPFRFFNDKFNELLKFTKFTEDRAYQSRTLYSLRHIYATQALLSGTDSHTHLPSKWTPVCECWNHTTASLRQPRRLREAFLDVEKSKNL